MKTNRFIQFLAATVCVMMCAACMDGDWEAPKNTLPPYGNNDIEATNIVSLAQLKSMYPRYAEDGAQTEMTQSAQLKVYVTGNDIQDNIHNAIAVQDEAGDAIIIAVSENAMHGYLPVGQELIIETKGLYIGANSGQPQIGYPFTNKSGSTSVGRMSSTLWNSHFRLLPTKHEVVPIEFDPKMDITANCGKLMTIKNVKVQGANGILKWAPEEDATGNGVSRYLEGMGKNIEIYTSTMCDFANAVIPAGPVNITGIWKRYRDNWEVSLRSEEDVEPLSD